MKKLKIFILLGVILTCSVASAVIFQDHGASSSIFYINIDSVPPSNSTANLKRGESYKCAMGFNSEYDVISYEFKVYLVVSGISVPFPVFGYESEQALPWREGLDVDLHFDLNIPKDYVVGRFPMKVEVLDQEKRRVVNGSFVVEIR